MKTKWTALPPTNEVFSYQAVGGPGARSARSPITWSHCDVKWTMVTCGCYLILNQPCSLSVITSPAAWFLCDLF